MKGQALNLDGLMLTPKLEQEVDTHFTFLHLLLMT